MMVSTDGLDLDELAQVLYSAVVSDSCDRQGLWHQTASPALRSMSAPGTPIVGWARTVRSTMVSQPPSQPYATEIRYVDSLRRGDVVVACAEGDHSGFWGELFSTAAMGRGARGAVIDGYVRDRQKMNALGFPVYARGSRPADSNGRLSVTMQDEPLDFLGVTVRTGDLVVADFDGIAIVPAADVGPVISYAVTKARLEDDGRALLLSGGLLADVWKTFKVL